MRMDASTLELQHEPDRSHISYSEPMAFTVIAGRRATDYIATVSPEIGLRIYDAEDLTRTVAHATSASLHTWGDTFFRPDPAHLVHVAG